MSRWRSVVPFAVAITLVGVGTAGFLLLRRSASPARESAHRELDDWLSRNALRALYSPAQPGQRVQRELRIALRALGAWAQDAADASAAPPAEPPLPAAWSLALPLWSAPPPLPRRVPWPPGAPGGPAVFALGRGAWPRPPALPPLPTGEAPPIRQLTAKLELVRIKVDGAYVAWLRKLGGDEVLWLWVREAPPGSWPDGKPAPDEKEEEEEEEEEEAIPPEDPPAAPAK